MFSKAYRHGCMVTASNKLEICLAWSTTCKQFHKCSMHTKTHYMTKRFQSQIGRTFEQSHLLVARFRITEPYTQANLITWIVLNAANRFVKVWGSQRYWLAHLDFPAHTIPPEWNDLCAHCDGQCETKVVILHMFARALKMHTWLHDVPSLVWGLKKN